MHGPEESDSVIVAVKPTNKAEQSVAEPVEPRTETKGNADQQSTRRAQDRASVSQALERVRQVAPGSATDCSALFVGFTATITESDSSGPCIVGYDSSSCPLAGRRPGLREFGPRDTCDILQAVDESASSKGRRHDEAKRSANSHLACRQPTAPGGAHRNQPRQVRRRGV